MTVLLGEKCFECGRKHLVKSMEIYNSLSPKDRVRVYKSSHRIFRDGYLFSLNMKEDSEVWEWYSALSISKLQIIEEKEEEEKKKCISCSKEISEEESNLYNGMCANCYMIELQDLDDLE